MCSEIYSNTYKQFDIYKKGLEDDENVNESIKITKDDIMEMVEESIKKILSK